MNADNCVNKYDADFTWTVFPKCDKCNPDLKIIVINSGDIQNE